MQILGAQLRALVDWVGREGANRELAEGGSPGSNSSTKGEYDPENAAVACILDLKY